MASRGNGKNAGKSAKRSIGFSEKQLAKKFKHAGDFGVKGNYNQQADGNSILRNSNTFYQREN